MMGGRPNRRLCGQLDKLKLLQSLGLLIESKSNSASCPCAKRSNKRVRERPGSYFESGHCGERFLLILNMECIRLQDAFDSRRDLIIRQAINAVQDPDSFDHGDNADETRAPLS